MMKKLSILLLVLFVVVFAHAQDVSITMTTTTSTGEITDGTMSTNSTGYLKIVIYNNDDEFAVPEYSLRPQVSVPGGIVKITNAILPQGWNICSKNDGNIILSNGTDEIQPVGSATPSFRVIYIQYVSDIRLGTDGATPNTQAIILFGGGDASIGCENGPSTVGDAGGNNSSSTTISVSDKLLPVTIVDFKGSLNQGNVLLNWASATELNFNRYEVERSTDGSHFAKIGSVSATGSNSKYQYVDATANAGVNYYYRLKMVDIDGTSKYSGIVQLKIPVSETISVFPNPTFGKVKVSGLQGGEQLKVIGIAGQAIGSWTANKGTTELDLSGKASGLYCILVMRQNQIEATLKVIKN